jgi:hypothetical protein
MPLLRVGVILISGRYNYSNEFGSNVENVVPGQISSATSAFYLVYDYACNTDYSER